MPYGRGVVCQTDRERDACRLYRADSPLFPPSRTARETQPDGERSRYYAARPRSTGVKTIVTERDEQMLARIEGDDRVFEVNFDSVEPTDVTLRFVRGGERVGSIYNDDGTDRTMARLTTGREGADFIGVEVPKEFVAELLDAAVDAGRVTDDAAAEGYRMRVL